MRVNKYKITHLYKNVLCFIDQLKRKQNNFRKCLFEMDIKKTFVFLFNIGFWQVKFFN